MFVTSFSTTEADGLFECDEMGLFGSLGECTGLGFDSEILAVTMFLLSLFFSLIEVDD